jgi:phosphate uptake regulator
MVSVLVERRKAQQVGQHTLTISLPKAWVKRKGLSKGDYLVITEQLDGSLRLDVDSPLRQAPTVLIDVSRFSSAHALRQALLSWYMLGFDEVHVKGRLTDELLSVIHALAKRMRGIEAVEVSPSRVVLRSFLEESRYPVDALISRLFALISSMVQYLLNAVREGKPEYLNEVSRLRSDVEELYWLIVRQLLLALRRPELAAKLAIESPLHATGNRLVARSLLTSAILLDECAELLFQPIGAKKWTAELGQGIGELLARVGELLRQVMSFLDKADLPTFFAYTETAEEVDRIAERLLSRAPREPEPSTGVGYLLALERLANVAFTAENISEVAIHRLVRRMVEPSGG